MMHEQLSISYGLPIIVKPYNYERFTYPWHFHREYEIIYVSEGVGERFVADSLDLFKPGDVILLGHNVPHYMRSADPYYTANPSLRTKGVIIQFANDYMSHTINTYADLSPIKLLLEQSKRGIYFEPPENKEIIRSINSLSDFTGVERIVKLLLLLDQMANVKRRRFLGSPHFNQNLSVFTDNRLEKVLSYITFHYTHPLTLTEIASLISMNTSAFSRYFKEKTGKSVVEYIQDLRVGYACKLLTGSSLDISQISIECGFNTICHFNRIFKRKTGVVPSEYKKQFLK